MQRNELVIRASAVGLDPTTYVNDSKLGQKILWLEKRGTTFSGTLATGTLTSDATQSADGDTTVIGGITYTWKTALSEVAASSTLTFGGTPSDGDIVTVGAIAYTFRTTLTNSGTAPYEVLINGSAANALTKLKAAVLANGTAGTDYGIGTLVHPTVSAGTKASSTLVFNALSLGTAGNNIPTSVPIGTNETWTGAFLTGGVNPVLYQVLIDVSAAAQLDNIKSAINATTGMGTTYSTGTPAHPQVTATTNTDTTQIVQAIDYTVTNADIPTTNPTDTGSHLSWGATTLTSGVKKQIAVNTTTYSGAQGVSGDADVQLDHVNLNN